MKKLLMIIPLVILLCFTFGCQQGEEVAEEAKQAVDVEADIAAINQLTQEVQNAFNTGNIEKYMTTIDDNAVFMPSGEEPLIGKEAIRNFYHFDQVKFDVSITTHETQICGDLAFGWANWEGTSTENSVTSKFKANDMYAFKRQPDGSWKTSHAIWNFIYMEAVEK